MPEGVCGCGEVALDVRACGDAGGGGVVWVLRMGDVDVAELLWMLWGFYVDVVYG